MWKEDAEIVEVFHSNAGDLGVDEIFEFVEQCENEENVIILKIRANKQIV